MVGFILVAFIAAPIEIGISAAQIRASKGSVMRAIVVNGKVGFAAEKEFVRQAVSATIPKTFAEERAMRRKGRYRV